MNRILITLLAIVTFAALFSSCAKPEESTAPESQPTEAQGPKEDVPVIPPPVADTVPAPAPNMSAPKKDEILSALIRVMGSVVEIHSEPNMTYVAGDFNGDESQDIAVVVKPAEESLSEINSDLANWTSDDLSIPSQLDPNKATQPLPPKPAPVRFEQSDLMLAIIHGYGPEGWRNPEARQIYLLKHAVGNEMKMFPLKSALLAFKNKEGMPRLRGDAIRQTMEGEKGFIYWTGGRYAWHPPAKIASR